MPPITPSLEELESFHWTLIGMYLFIIGGLCLLLAVHVHIHHPLPHERRWDNVQTSANPNGFDTSGSGDLTLPPPTTLTEAFVAAHTDVLC
jgi:hypothetical protein